MCKKTQRQSFELVMWVRVIKQEGIVSARTDLTRKYLVCFLYVKAKVDKLCFAVSTGLVQTHVWQLSWLGQSNSQPGKMVLICMRRKNAQKLATH